MGKYSRFVADLFIYYYLVFKLISDVDHTCYTLSTAGSEGFCTLLPIYMDHIFHPILSVR